MVINIVAIDEISKQDNGLCMCTLRPSKIDKGLAPNHTKDKLMYKRIYRTPHIY